MLNTVFLNSPVALATLSCTLFRKNVFVAVFPGQKSSLYYVKCTLSVMLVLNLDLAVSNFERGSIISSLCLWCHSIQHRHNVICGYNHTRPWHALLTSLHNVSI